MGLGSGGGGEASQIPDLQKTFIGLISVGTDKDGEGPEITKLLGGRRIYTQADSDAGNIPMGSAIGDVKPERANEYELNPSVLRYIWEFGIGNVANPYANDVSGMAGISPFDPDADITLNQTELTNYKNLLANIATNQVDEDLLGKAKILATGLLDEANEYISTTEWNAIITTAVNQFRDRHLPELARARAELQSRYSELDATQSSAYLIANANLQSEFNNRLSDFDSALSVDIGRQEVELFVRSILQSMQMVAQHQKESAILQADINKLKWIAKGEELESELSYRARERTWDLDVYQQGVNIISAASGAVVPNPRTPSKGQTALGTTAVGASIGVQAGGAPGAAIGAGVGLLAGLALG